ncbi:cell division protein FtsQ/DivIB [Fulvivirgaceae bacterium BMA10]|uniref:Cell division protein FtsQ/DivIB n=1 Tax=Splendidivirga corallicola TaxID=3051826 RepID=A0ABT8KMH0_9BACT|nr:cell division protein FtsQ/DivIB [Fulvivirgaceae bacterium BMA10]
MKSKAKITKGLIIASAAILVFFIIGSISKKQNGKVINAISIHVEDQYDNFFIDENDILKLINDGHTNSIVGVPVNDLELKEIETNIKSNPFVRTAEVYRDLKGNLMVKVKPRKPMARILINNGPDAYIDSGGEIIPTSDEFTARVVLISGTYTKKLMTEKEADQEVKRNLTEMLKAIDGDKFLRAQVAQLDMDNEGRITIYPQIGKQYIEFGRPVNVEEKFKKLKILFKRILPERGWNTFSRVNIEYNNQIVCE